MIVGGHVSTAFSVIEILKKKQDIKLHFFGRKYAFEEHKKESFEYQLIRKQKIPFYDIAGPRLPRRNIFKLLAWLPKLLFCVISIRKLFVLVNPSLVVSFGGYLGGAVSFSAWMSNIPVVIHEQTRKAGFANRYCAFFARKILIAWKESYNYFHPLLRKKITLIGNPIRNTLLSVHPKSKAGKDWTLYITGGSTGAHAVNKLIASILPRLLLRFRIIHQCGDSQFHDFDGLSQLVESLSPKLRSRYQLIKFVDDNIIASVFSKADIIIGRAGANTVLELAMTGKQAILIPHPGSAGREQTANAALLAQAGSAIVLDQKGLTGDELYKSIDDMVENFPTYQKHAQIFSKTSEIVRHRMAASLFADCISKLIFS